MDIHKRRLSAPVITAVLLVAAGLAAPAAQATTRYVDADAPAGGDG